MKNHWNSTIKRKVDTGGFLSESKDCKPPVYLLLELEDKDGPQSVHPEEGQVRWLLGVAPGRWVGLQGYPSLSHVTSVLPCSPYPQLFVSSAGLTRAGVGRSGPGCARPVKPIPTSPS